jgi:FMN phosphatase YigB (HAD superfamily)
MLLFLFDCGGTIINDPFPTGLERLLENLPADAPDVIKRREVLTALVEAWKVENANFSFPLASHFLQEEIWIVRALNRLAAVGLVAVPDIPLIAPVLLGAYRRSARQAIVEQPQLPGMRASLEWLRRQQYAVGVASNDRHFATRTMLAWAGLEGYMDWIFTSDGFSDGDNIIEKPSAAFFERAEAEIFEKFSRQTITHKIYIGDNERNDVECPMRLGYTTVRFINRNNPKDATWLDHREKTSAPYWYDDPDGLRPLLETIANNVGAMARS